MPKQPLNLGEQVKFYPGALQAPLASLLDTQPIEAAAMKVLHTVVPETRHITFVRHLESKYNEYKNLLKQDPNYQRFLQTQDPSEKEQLAQVLMRDFFEKVGIDYETNLSTIGHQQGEQL